MAEKQLDCTRAAGEHQKAWFAQLREDVFERQRPYAIIQADMPFELFQVMEVPVVSNQWWAAIISAKRLSGYYLDILNAAVSRLIKGALLASPLLTRETCSPLLIRSRTCHFLKWISRRIWPV